MRCVFSLLLLSFAAHAGDPVIGTGDAAAQQAQPPPIPGPPQTTVQAPRVWGESEKSGPYHQPGWSERRRFPGTRVYVAPAGSASFEFWLENKTPVGGDNRLRTLYEIALGLGHRLQLDLYVRTEVDGQGPMFLESERLEVRWALADWGVIPGNPTLYLEWIRPTDGPMKGELKLLLAGELSPRLYWGFNLFFERELWGTQQVNEYGFTGGLSYSLFDSKLSLGLETRLELVDVRDRRFSPDEIEVLIGPTLAWRPVPQANLLLVWFLGPGLERAPGEVYKASFVMQPTLVAGWKF
jgi:hypothetical protein